jgi:hypothetical protein
MEVKWAAHIARMRKREMLIKFLSEELREGRDQLRNLAGWTGFIWLKTGTSKLLL